MKICLSIGYPIKSSRSPSIHNAGYKALGIDDKYTYIRKEVKPKDLKKVMEEIRTQGISGVSVTMPHKQEVMKYLDKIDDDALKIGAVNTVVNKDGKLIGFNTDWIGAIVALEKRTNLEDKKVAIIGAGGAARAIVYGLIKKGAKVKIFNRSKDSAQQIAEEFGCEYGSLDSLEEISNMDIIINATSVGMNEDKSPIDKRFLNNKQIVFDIVYSPKETRFIKDAIEKGATIISGYEMLLYQGVEQFKLYTGLQAPVEAMREELLRSLK